MDGVCIASETYSNGGTSGPLTCTSAGADETTGNLSIANMSIGAHGFSGTVSITLKGSCDFGGIIGGVKRQ